MYKEKGPSAMDLLTRIQAQRNNAFPGRTIGYAEMVERKMKEKADADEYKRSQEERYKNMKKRQVEELLRKFESLIERANETRSNHPEDYAPVYWPNPD